MINIGDVNIGNEIILNSFQSQVYSETLKKLEQFGIAGYDIDHESYIIQKTLAKHIAETVSSEEETISEIPRLSQVVFKTLTNPDLYDSDIVNEELIQWVDVGNPYSFFLMKGELTDLSGNANDILFPKSRVTTNGFRKNGTVINREIPSLDFNGKGSRLNATVEVNLRELWSASRTPHDLSLGRGVTELLSRVVGGTFVVAYRTALDQTFLHRHHPMDDPWVAFGKWRSAMAVPPPPHP